MPAIAAGFVFTHHDRRRLTAAMRQTRGARHCRRLQAVRLVAEGRQAGEVAALLKASRRRVTKTLACYRQRRCPSDLAEAPRAGRPPLAPALSRNLLTVTLEADPPAFGYAASGWTAPLLAAHLRAFHSARRPPRACAPCAAVCTPPGWRGSVRATSLEPRSRTAHGKKGRPCAA